MVMAREKLRVETDGLTLVRARCIGERLVGRSLGRMIADDALELPRLSGSRRASASLDSRFERSIRQRR